MPTVKQTRQVEIGGSRYYVLSFGDGTEKLLRSVTTICGSVRVKSYLDEWEDQKIEELGIAGFQEYMELLADDGTLMHSLIERKISGENIVKTFDIDDAVWQKFNSFLAWYERRQPKFLWLEKTLFSLRGGYAGRSDASVLIDGAKLIIDFKSSKRATDSHRCQVSAYLKAAEEAGDKHDGCLVLCLGAENTQGYSETYLYKDKPCKKSPDENEIDFYYRGFSLKNELLNWATPFPKEIPCEPTRK